MRKRFRANLVRVGRVHKPQEGHWEFCGTPVSGTIFEYPAVDENFQPAAKWTFIVRVPDIPLKGNYIEVRPIRYPQRKCWAGIDQKSITFNKATKPNYRGCVYAKLFLADVYGEQTKVGVRWGERASLPAYIRKFKLRLKGTVTGTKGTDYYSQVAVFDPDNHAGMIHLFLSTKAWVLYSGFSLH